MDKDVNFQMGIQSEAAVDINIGWDSNPRPLVVYHISPNQIYVYLDYTNLCLLLLITVDSKLI